MGKTEGKKTEKRLHIRIEEGLHEKIKEKAEKENRTISSYVLNLVMQDLEKED